MVATASHRSQYRPTVIILYCCLHTLSAHGESTYHSSQRFRVAIAEKALRTELGRLWKSVLHVEMFVNEYIPKK